jgi:hypothetical protein
MVKRMMLGTDYRHQAVFPFRAGGPGGRHSTGGSAWPPADPDEKTPEPSCSRQKHTLSKTQSRWINPGGIQ